MRLATERNPSLAVQAHGRRPPRRRPGSPHSCCRNTRLPTRPGRSSGSENRRAFCRLKAAFLARLTGNTHGMLTVLFAREPHRAAWSRQRRRVRQPSAAFPSTALWFLSLLAATRPCAESARGLAHSKTWRHFGRFMESLRGIMLATHGDHKPRGGDDPSPQHAWTGRPRPAGLWSAQNSSGHYCLSAPMSPPAS
jgi:hypothetical protein